MVEADWPTSGSVTIENAKSRNAMPHGTFADKQVRVGGRHGYGNGVPFSVFHRRSLWSSSRGQLNPTRRLTAFEARVGLVAAAPKRNDPQMDADSARINAHAGGDFHGEGGPRGRRQLIDVARGVG